jgi:iron complex outermembrane recepter protein
MEEIVVTARRREEALTAVPITLTALDGALLDNLQYRGIDDILGLSPGVMTYTGGDSASTRVSIRGVVSPGEFVEPGNAVYVNEIYASGMLSVWPAFHDIDSVQVLKGPQAGLYGRNTMGGAVLITTTQPTDQYTARVGASYAQYDARAVDGMINAPLSEQVRLRAVGWYSDENGGYYESGLTGDNLDAYNQQGARLTLAVLPHERLDISLTGEVDQIDGDGFTNGCGVLEGIALGPAPLPPESRRNVLRDDLGGLDQDQTSVYSKLNLETNAGTVVALAGWRESTWREPNTDFDGTAFITSYEEFLTNPLTAAPQALVRDDSDTLRNAELRFLSPDIMGPLKVQVGLNYFDEDASFFDQIIPLREFAQSLTANGQYGSWVIHASQDTTAWAGFGEVIWTPVEVIELTADLRYTWEQKSFDFMQSTTGYYADFEPAFVQDTNENFTNWSPGITLAYRPVDTQTYYIKYVRGFHAGGFNTLVNNPELFPYESEEAENYELGGKGLLFQQRLELGASVFYLRIDNAVIPLRDPGTLPVFPLQNATVAETTGLEIDLALRPGGGLSLTASAGAYDSDTSVEVFGGAANRAFVPRYTASLVADYQHALAESVTGTATLGFRHRSGGRVPSITKVEMDSFNLLDAQVGVLVDNVLVAAFVQNALDDDYIISNFDPVQGQYPYIIASGLRPLAARAIVRDPGTVFGVRMTVTF